MEANAEEESCFGDWKSVKEKKSKRPDMHALMLIDTLFPRKSDLICGAEHDCIHLDVELEEVAELTEDQIIELLRCGFGLTVSR